MESKTKEESMNLLTKIDLLKTEYFKLQDFYEASDSKAQTIKGLSATICLAAITFGFSYKSEFIWLLAALTSLVIWIIEAKWKQFQYCYADRIEQIEEAFKKNDFNEIKPLQIYSSWFKTWRKGEYKVIELMFMKIVMIPYLYAIVICLVLFIIKLSIPGLFW
jgi:hypothetical protein